MKCNKSSRNSSLRHTQSVAKAVRKNVRRLQGTRVSIVDVFTDSPSKYAKFLIKHPCVIICITLICCAIICFVDAMVFELTQDNDRDYFLNNDENTHRLDAVALSKADIIGSGKIQALPKTQKDASFDMITLFKTRDNSNILQPNYLNYINATNSKIIKTSYNDYYKLCLADSFSFPDCSSTAVVGKVANNLTEIGINEWINKSISMSGARDIFYAHFESSFASNTKSSAYFRTFFRFGLPFPDISNNESSYKNIHDNYDKQRQQYDDYIYPIYKDIVMQHNDDENIEVVVYGQRVSMLASEELTMAGLMWAVGSIVSVFLFMLFHMKSIFLTTMGMLQIILGFPISYILYRLVLKVTYFNALQALVIFIILGIAADDFFVFVDAWVQSEQVIKDKQDILSRMTYTFHRAAKAMFTTTFTTTISFLSISISQIMPIAAFGLWAAIVVSVNYLLMLTFYPACLSFWYQYIRKYEKLPNIFNSNSANEKNENEKYVQSSRWTERFLRDKWSKFVIQWKYYILLFFAVLFSLSVWQTTQLKGLTEPTRLWPDNHFLTKQFSWQDKFYGGSSNNLIPIHLIWGINPRVDRSGTDKWSSTDLGTPSYDETFDLSPVDAQLHIYNICNLLTSNKTYSYYKIYAPQTISCFMYDLINYASISSKYSKMTFPYLFSTHSKEIQTLKFNELIYDWITYDIAGKQYAANGLIGYKQNDDALKFIILSFKLAEKKPSRSHDTKKKAFLFWDKTVMQQWNQNASVSISNGFVASSTFAWMASEKAFVTSAIQGVVIALPLSFICLLITTQNWIMSVFAVTTIIGIIFSEVAIMVLQGWELGVAESIAVVIIIGFSVDFVAHLANSYVECTFSNKRLARIKFALYTIGISVVYGAITTFSSGFWLLFPEMTFFYKFGILIMTVIILSLLYSMVYFIALLAAFGPNNESGKIPLRKIFCCCKKK